jgi:hypothetical protein
MTFDSTPTLALYNEKEKITAMLDEHGVGFWNSQGHLIESLGLGFLTIAGDGDSGAVVAPGKIGVFNEQGFSAALGVNNLVTPRSGETHKTSAASLVLFDKNKNVIWKAP